jgi:hypothetical protein
LPRVRRTPARRTERAAATFASDVAALDRLNAGILDLSRYVND